MSSPPVSVSSDPHPQVPVSQRFPSVFRCPQAIERLQESETVEGDVVASICVEQVDAGPDGPAVLSKAVGGCNVASELHVVASCSRGRAPQC
eukprot:3729394-Rhodomonas_salina.1